MGMVYCPRALNGNGTYHKPHYATEYSLQVLAGVILDISSKEKSAEVSWLWVLYIDNCSDMSVQPSIVVTLWQPHPQASPSGLRKPGDEANIMTLQPSILAGAISNEEKVRKGVGCEFCIDNL